MYCGGRYAACRSYFDTRVSFAKPERRETLKSHWIKRIVRLLILLFGVSILCFILTALSSTDPAAYLVRRGNLSPTPEVIEQVRTELGLDQPLPIRYFNWIGGVFHGDFGESIFSTNEVAADLAAYFPQTLQLVFLALAEIIVFSILLGVLCAAQKNKLTDHIMRIVSLFGICVPAFWLGFLLLIGFAVEIPIFSVTPAPGRSCSGSKRAASAVPMITFDANAFHFKKL